MHHVENSVTIIFGKHGSAACHAKTTQCKNNLVLLSGLFWSLLHIPCQQGHARDVTKVKAVDYLVDEGRVANLMKATCVF